MSTDTSKKGGSRAGAGQAEKTLRTASADTGKKKGAGGRSVLAHISIYVAALIFASRLIYALFSAMKPNNEMFTSPPRLVGSQIKWTNFIEVFTYGPFVTYMLNSLFVSVAGTILVLIVSSASAFAFARLRWKGRDAVFLLFLATLMVPAEVVMIPMYTLMDWFGWINSYQALIIPFAFSAFGTFLLRQFYRGIPFELDEAARVDGAGALRIYLNIILPLSRSAIAVLAVFTFLGFWNSYLWPLIVTVDYSTLGTLPVGLATFSTQQGTRWDLQMAAAVISMVPTTALVIALQKHLVKGIALAGLGGR